MFKHCPEYNLTSILGFGQMELDFERKSAKRYKITHFDFCGFVKILIDSLYESKREI